MTVGGLDLTTLLMVARRSSTLDGPYWFCNGGNSLMAVFLRYTPSLYKSYFVNAENR